MSWIQKGCTIAALALFTTAISCAPCPCVSKRSQPDAGAVEVADSELGLSKTSVFDVPNPVVAAEAGEAPGENPLAGGYFSESPPLIPHAIESLLPITVDNNMCIACHDAPDRIGTETAAGVPPPIPATHYTDLRKAPETVTATLIGARFFCDQCHVPQTDAEPLVTNSYGR